MPKKGGTDAVDYKEELKKRHWTYRKEFFPKVEEYFDRRFDVLVFRTGKQCHNVLVRPGATREECARVFHLLPIA